ncbi:MAG: hypothetical protein ACRC92_26460 [Peptostreptococcaceae bacterium]
MFNLEEVLNMVQQNQDVLSLVGTTLLTYLVPDESFNKMGLKTRQLCIKLHAKLSVVIPPHLFGVCGSRARAFLKGLKGEDMSITKKEQGTFDVEVGKEGLDSKGNTTTDNG